MLWLIVVPVALFLIPALMGRPGIDADNLIQNYPLRVLVGRQLASGHLPLLNPLANSGTPLLGGMNAGALYPLTIIFAFVPPIAAWLVNLIVVYFVAALGVFSLLRWHGLRTWSSFVAGVGYAYTGAMIGQIVHLGVIQGYSFLPWMTLLMLALSKRLTDVPNDASRGEMIRCLWPWSAGVGLLWGLTFLTGEPRAIADMELVILVVVPGVLLLRSTFWMSTWRQRVWYVLTLLVGFAWGVGLGLVQLLPGWSFINFSQRSTISYGYFGDGSLAVHWTALLFNPDLFGGNGALAQTGYFANYNLAEVTGYAGIVALLGAAAFFTRLTRRGWRGRERDYTLYVVVMVVGLFATWGSFTPLGHVFRAIPLFGSTRLQSRNVILVDFALAVFTGWWLDAVMAPTRERVGLGRRSKWLTLAPAFVVVALCVGLLGWGPALINGVGITDGKAYLATGLKFLTALHLVVALAAIAVVIGWRQSRHALRWLLVVFVVDLVVFSLFTSTGLVGGPQPSMPSKKFAAQELGTKGRFALVDFAGQHTNQYRALGEPNMNVFTGLASAQGYGSLISTIYDNATGTHPQAMVDACHLANGTFEQLRLATVAISSSQLASVTTQPRVRSHSCVKLAPSTSTRRYFGQVWRVSSVTLESATAQVAARGEMSLRFMNRNGQLIGTPYVLATSSSTTLHLTRAIQAAGFEVTSPSALHVVGAYVRRSSGQMEQLNSNFQLAVSTSSWRLSATPGTFAIFRATSLRPAAWVSKPTSGARVTDVRYASWGDAWVSVRAAKPSILVRSEAYLPGWRATARNVSSGRSLGLVVHRRGLVQSVTVPSGTWVIHFHYHAPYIERGLAGSAISWLLLAGAAVGLAKRRRTNHRDRNARVLT
jgi:hypothetical protein